MTESIASLFDRLAAGDLGIGPDASDDEFADAMEGLSDRLMAQEPATLEDLARQVLWWTGYHDGPDAGEFLSATPIMHRRLLALAGREGPSDA